ncbi:hypothetical protein [Curtobacterium sp. 9128]|uniref:hypothetical protein n=1 Tax=Curtobacterium sp. 9128 TaxID=1793722 RepID=UPI0011A5E35F|nr:hypothetical protein [Curtobacterium sp. 9128]
MPQALSGTAASPHRTAFSVLLGGLLGLLAGMVLDGALWLWAFASVLDGAGAVDVGPVVHASDAGGTVTAVGGPGVLLLPLGLACVGAVVVWLFRGRAARHPASVDAA